ncbi:MAG: hypothetical protein HFG57_11210, partial [Lachnospiraceae bacterium]|nr:hypothetical protein [Lachnospiraceae bacterium]
MSKKSTTVTPAPVNDDVVVAEKFHLSDMLHKEDWLSIWGAFIIIAIASLGVISGAFAFKAGTFGKWGSEESGSILKFFNGSDACLSTWSGILLTLVALIIIFAVSNQLMGKNITKYAISFLALFGLTCLVRLISSQVTFSKYLEYA